MLHRSASSRRRRQSRSVASQPTPLLQQQQQQQQPVPIGQRSRRASVASAEPASEALLAGAMDRQRSPRGSCVPNIALDPDDEALEETFSRRLLPDPEQCGASRLCLTPEASRSSRTSLAPDEYGPSRSPRGSLVPVDPRGRSPRNSLVPELSRSPRHSLVPDAALSPRNSLVPLDVIGAGYSRSPRGSLVPVTPRAGLAPENGGRSPRHSLIPEAAAAAAAAAASAGAAQLRSSRASLANVDFDRSPRGSICPDTARSPRGSITPVDVHGEMKQDRSPRGSIASECLNQSPRGSIAPDLGSRSPRGSIAPDLTSRSPRGSICPEPGSRSPRGSIVPGHGGHEGLLANRSPRGSIGMGELGHRGSLAGAEEVDGPTSRSPRGSIGPASELERSPRGSLGGGDRRLPEPGAFGMAALRRTSFDQSTVKNRSTSPYRQRTENSGSVRSAGSMTGGQVSLGYGAAANTWIDSRRASSSVSQFSGDESRRLCGGGGPTGTSFADKVGPGSSGPMGVAAYGSLVFQLKDAHLEASGTCDFVLRALRVVSKTTVVTVFLAFLSTMPVVMLILGVQSIRDCPLEPNIPLYMVVGGSLGSLRMFWLLYSRIRARRPELLSVPVSGSHVSFKRLASVLLSTFLLVWFGLGNYWILRIRWPDYEPKHYDPNRWCDKTLYIFALVHLGIVYLALFASIVVGFGLLFCRILACPWPERYK